MRNVFIVYLMVHIELVTVDYRPGLANFWKLIHNSCVLFAMKDERPAAHRHTQSILSVACGWLIPMHWIEIVIVGSFRFTSSILLLLDIKPLCGHFSKIQKNNQLDTLFNVVCRAWPFCCFCCCYFLSDHHSFHFSVLHTGISHSQFIQFFRLAIVNARIAHQILNSVCVVIFTIFYGVTYINTF